MEKALATPTMRTKVLVLLSLGHLATDLAAGAWPVLLPILQASLHLSYSAAGVIALVFNVSSSVIQPLLGYWSDRVKSRWLLPAGVLLSTAGLALAGFVSTYWLILAVVFMSGLGSAAYHPEASKVSRLASGSRLATGMSLFIVGGALGAALGSLVMAQLLHVE
ncbi:MAG: MFS transporter, partial [Firmicutes bacterium]|nr:MFS transporter [Bacillota bacterium]